MQWLICKGYRVWLPVGHSPNVDVVAEGHDAQLPRVQVKTTTRLERRRWQVAPCTRGGNQSWNGLVKRFTASRCDWLFALSATGDDGSFRRASWRTERVSVWRVRRMRSSG